MYYILDPCWRAQSLAEGNPFAAAGQNIHAGNITMWISLRQTWKMNVEGRYGRNLMRTVQEHCLMSPE